MARDEKVCFIVSPLVSIRNELSVILAFTSEISKWGEFLLVLMYLRRNESKRCSSTGLGPDGVCTYIESALILPHGMNYIIFGRNARIGSNGTIMQGVSIAEGNREKTTIIEDDVLLGAGCVILNNLHIGKGAKIGTNAVVLHDVPAYATAVGVPARIIIHNENDK